MHGEGAFLAPVLQLAPPNRLRCASGDPGACKALHPSEARKQIQVERGRKGWTENEAGVRVGSTRDQESAQRRNPRYLGPEHELHVSAPMQKLNEWLSVDRGGW